MNKVNFTEENLSKIHISQFEQFLNNHGIEYTKQYLFSELYDKGSHWIYVDRLGYGFMEIKNNHYYVDDLDITWFENIITKIYRDYIQGDLTQFHILFTEVYNEIMGYEIK